VRRIACQGSPAPDDAPKGYAGLYGGKILRLGKSLRRSPRPSCLEECFNEPLSDDDPEPMGNCPLKHLSPQKVRRLVEKVRWRFLNDNCGAN
jgi:hypothetical protein